MFVPRIIGPRKGASPVVSLAQQLPLITVDRKNDASEVLLPGMAPSEISVAILLQLLQRRTVDLGVRLLTLLPLERMADGSQKVRSWLSRGALRSHLHASSSFHPRTMRISLGRPARGWQRGLRHSCASFLGRRPSGCPAAGFRLRRRRKTPTSKNLTFMASSFSLDAGASPGQRLGTSSTSVAAPRVLRRFLSALLSRSPRPFPKRRG